MLHSVPSLVEHTCSSTCGYVEGGRHLHLCGNQLVELLALEA